MAVVVRGYGDDVCVEMISECFAPQEFLFRPLRATEEIELSWVEPFKRSNLHQKLP